jgi:hypothetical protein
MTARTNAAESVALRNRDGQFLLQGDAVLPIYSLTKPFIAASVLAAGIDVSKPISTWLDPDLVPHGKNITVADGQFAEDLPGYPAQWVWHGLLLSSAEDVARFMASDQARSLGHRRRGHGTCARTRCSAQPGHPVTNPLRGPNRRQNIIKCHLPDTTLLRQAYSRNRLSKPAQMRGNFSTYRPLTRLPKAGFFRGQCGGITLNRQSNQPFL